MPEAFSALTNYYFKIDHIIVYSAICGMRKTLNERLAIFFFIIYYFVVEENKMRPIMIILFSVYPTKYIIKYNRMKD